MQILFRSLLFATLVLASQQVTVAKDPKFLTEAHLKCSPCEPVYAPFDVSVDGLMKMLKKSKAKGIKKEKKYVTEKPLTVITCDDNYNRYEFQFDVEGHIMSVQVEQAFSTEAGAGAQFERLKGLSDVMYEKSYSQHSRLRNYTKDCHNMVSNLRLQHMGTKVLQTFTYVRM